MIKAIFMDIDNTLLDFSECAKFAMTRAFEKNNIPFKDEYFSTFTKINHSLWREIEKGRLDKEGLYKTRWKNIFSELNINFNGELFEKDFVSSLFDSYQTVDGAEEILKYLKNKYILCAATNGPHAEQYSRLKNAGLFSYFDHIFISEDFGAAKPSKKFFDSCVKYLPDIKKDEILLVGDSITADIVGGVEYGLKTCWFNYYKMSNTSNVVSDYKINNLYELENIV